MRKRDILALFGFVGLITLIVLLFFSANPEIIAYFKEEITPFAISIFALILVLSYFFYLIIASGKQKTVLNEQREKEISMLKANEKYRKEFLGNVSHELKTPLFNIQGYVSTLLEKEVEDADVQRKFLERTDKNINRLITVVNDLETISGIESGELKLNYSTFRIADLISEVMEMHEPQAIKRLIHLEFPHKNSELKVHADREKIHTVMSNLVSNAIHYGKEGGMAKVILKEQANAVTVYVIDDGIGISENELKRIFERFYRVDKSRSKEYGGTGLGLSIVKHLLERHNQTISLQSSPNEGSKFYFNLEKA